MLGTPFFLMDYVDGRVPPDVMPYTFGDNWFADAPAEQQRELQDSTVEVIAKLHSIPEPEKTFGFLADGSDSKRAAAQPRLAAVAGTQFAVPDIGRSALVERALEWLEANWPDDVAAAEPVLVWGDSRVGNVLYHGFRPVAVLDWEMATLGPARVRCRVDHLRAHGLPGTRRAGRPAGPAGRHARGGCARHLRRRTGVELGDLHWFYVYSGVIWAACSCGPAPGGCASVRSRSPTMSNRCSTTLTAETTYRR